MKRKAEEAAALEAKKLKMEGNILLLFRIKGINKTNNNKIFSTLFNLKTTVFIIYFIY